MMISKLQLFYNSMYSTVVFKMSLKRSMPDTILAKRLRNIMDTLTHNIYNYGCTGIFEKHKLLFSFQITIKLEQDVGNVTQEELDFFIKVLHVQHFFSSTHK